jgi:hypothetical protein
MKQLVLILVIFFFSIGLHAQNIEVPQSQSPMIVKIAASWCPPCGGWGWDFFDDIYSDNEDNAILLSVHHSGDHTNSAAQDMTVNFNVFSQPRYILDGLDQNVSSSNVNNKRVDIQNQVNSIIDENPVIQTGLDAKYANGKLKVDYSVKLFDDITGEYRLAMYLVEKVFIGYQASVGPDAAHKGLLRQELTGNSFGNILFSGAGASGDVFNGNIDIDLEMYDPENLEIVSVIWKKSANNFEFVNSNIDKEVQEDITSKIDVSMKKSPNIIVYPTHIKNWINIEIDQDSEGENVNIFIQDILSRPSAILFEGQLERGMNRLKFTKPDGMISGMYFLIFESKANKIVRKIFFE